MHPVLWYRISWSVWWLETLSNCSGRLCQVSMPFQRQDSGGPKSVIWELAKETGCRRCRGTAQKLSDWLSIIRAECPLYSGNRITGPGGQFSLSWQADGCWCMCCATAFLDRICKCDMTQLILTLTRGAIGAYYMQESLGQNGEVVTGSYWIESMRKPIRGRYAKSRSIREQASGFVD